jgi:hypothetical protein
MTHATIRILDLDRSLTFHGRVLDPADEQSNAL